MTSVICSTIISALTLSSVFAGNTSTVVNGLSVFHPEGKASVNYRDIAGGKTAHDQCLEAAKALAGKSTCSDVSTITTVSNCDGVVKPVIPRTLDADGFVVKPPMRGKPITETDWTTEVQDYVPAPAPECWVLGWREVTQADFEEDIIEDGPMVAAMETWSPELQVLWDNEVSVAIRALP